MNKPQQRDPKREAESRATMIKQAERHAPEVAKEHAELEAAKEGKLEAEHEFLGRLLDIIEEALPAMASKVEGLDIPAIAIDRDETLFLTRHKTWLVRSVIDPTKFIPCTTRALLADVDLWEILSALSIKLYAQVDSRYRSIRRIRDEEARIRALTTLLAPRP